MSDLFRQAHLAHYMQLHASAVAELQAMIAINQLRAQQGHAPAYNEAQLERQVDSIRAQIINPGSFY